MSTALSRPARSKTARRSPRRPALPKPLPQPVDAFEERLALADTAARRLLRCSLFTPEEDDVRDEFWKAVETLTAARPGYRRARALTFTTQDALKRTNPAAYTAFVAACWDVEREQMDAAYLLGVAVGKRLAPGVPL